MIGVACQPIFHGIPGDRSRNEHGDDDEERELTRKEA